MFHINEYLSLFEMSSGNLSVTMHRHVLEEGRRIFNHYGSFKNPILRKLIIFPRWMEKLMRGAYRPRNISYTYVMDDELHTKDFFARKADPRFRF